MNKVSFSELGQIDKASDLLIKAYGCDIDEITLPIDVEEIIKSLDKVSYSDESSFENWDKSGFIKVERNEKKELLEIKIWTNPSEVSERQRFTMSHELGHLFFDVLPQIGDSSKAEEIIDKFERSGKSSIREARANKFAAQLLMPAKLVKREVSDLMEVINRESKKISLQDAIDTLASKFQVSRLYIWS
jgi:Zn-dependent peptidase ImmA (M78 family)